MYGARLAGHHLVDLGQPGLGQVADLGVVDEDALHDARLGLGRLVVDRLLPGGVLGIAWDGAGVRMTGPAEFVAEGDLAPALAQEGG